MPVRGWFATALISWMLLTGSSALGQPVTMPLSELEGLVDSVVRDLAAERSSEAAQKMNRFGSAFAAENLQKVLQGVSTLGKPIYTDKVVDRAYGRTGKDIIYKIAYPQNMLFVRFVVHKLDGEGWTVFRFTLQNENETPLPRAWQHIYP